MFFYEEMAHAIRILGDIESISNDNFEAKHAYENSLILATQLNNVREKGFALLCLGKIAIDVNEQSAREHLEKAYELFNQIQSPFGKALTLKALSCLEIRWGSYKNAQQYLEKAFYIFQDLRYVPSKALTLVEIRILQHKGGHYEKCEKSYEESLELAHSLIQRSSPSSIYTNHGKLSLLSQNTETDYNYLFATIYYNYGKLNFKVSNLKESLEYFERAAFLFDKGENILCLIQTLRKIGKIEVHRKNFSSAEMIYQKAFNFARFRENKFEKSKLLKCFSILYKAMGDSVKSHDFLEKYALSLSPGNLSDELSLNLFLFKFHKRNSPDVAKSSLEKALSRAEELKLQKCAGQIYLKLASLEKDPKKRQHLDKKGKANITAIGLN